MTNLSILPKAFAPGVLTLLLLTAGCRGFSAPPGSSPSTGRETSGPSVPAASSAGSSASPSITPSTASAAGPIAGGLLTTSNGGSSFIPVPLDEKVVSVEVLQFTRADTGWMLVHSNDPKSGLCSGLQRSLDHGTTWRNVPVPSGLPETRARIRP